MLRYRLDIAPEIDEYELLGKRTPNIKLEAEEDRLIRDYEKLEDGQFLEKFEKNQNNLSAFRQENSLSNINGLFNIVQVDGVRHSDEFGDFEAFEKNRQGMSSNNSVLHFFQGKLYKAQFTGFNQFQVKMTPMSSDCWMKAKQIPQPKTTYPTWGLKLNLLSPDKESVLKDI